MRVLLDHAMIERTTGPTAEMATPTSKVSDMAFFNAQLGETAPFALTPMETNPLVQQATNLASLTSYALKGLNDLSLNKKTKAMNAVAGKLSDAHRELAVAVKVLNKSTQMVEKITSLQ